MNVTWLEQGLELVDEIGDEGFRRIGAQMRHVLEFYECFLDGLDVFHVDYDNRRRDPLLEQCPRAASARIRSLILRLSNEAELMGDGTVFVRMEDASCLEAPTPYLLSSVGRELQSLSSHTIHHFALIAMMLRAEGYPVEQNFGVAPSTLGYRAQAGIHVVAA